MLVGLDNLGKSRGDFVRMEQRCQLFLYERIAFGLLHLYGLVEKLTSPQVIQHEIQDLLAYSRVESHGSQFQPVAVSDALEWALLNPGSAIEASRTALSVR